MLQVNLLLAALSALLPLVPAEYRGRAAQILDAASAAASLGANLGDLAAKLAALRAEIAAMAGRDVTTEEMDQALARVREASTAFRAAIGTAAVEST